MHLYGLEELANEVNVCVCLETCAREVGVSVCTS